MADRLTLSIAEVAEVLGISRNHVYMLVRTEELPSLRLGRRIVVPSAALAQLVKDHSVIDLRDEAANSEAHAPTRNG